MEHRAPLISVIVPIYKTEAYLHQCVDSILGQTFSDFEVILVDDGSPDGCPAICDEYAAKDPRVRVVHKQNGGLVSARKAGLAECTGEYVMNVDSDDYIAPDLLEKVAKVLAENKVQAVLFGLTQFDGDDTWPLKGFLPQGLYAGEAMETIRQNLIQDSRGRMAVLYGIAAAALERETYAPFQNAVPEAVSRGEDLAVTAPLLAGSEAVYVLEACGYYYRSNPTSIMNSFREDELQQMQILTEYLAQKLGPEYGPKLDMYTATHYFDFLDRAMLRGYREYRQIIKRVKTEAILARVRRARVEGKKMKLIFFLLRHESYRLLWLLRKLKPRR